jgi:hypothetical protein
MAETPGMMARTPKDILIAALSRLHVAVVQAFTAPDARARQLLRDGLPPGATDSIAICHAVVSCSDWGRIKIYRLASSSVRNFLPLGKIISRSKHRFQDTKNSHSTWIQEWDEMFVPVGLPRCNASQLRPDGRRLPLTGSTRPSHLPLHSASYLRHNNVPASLIFYNSGPL